MHFLFYTILYTGFEHLWILGSLGVLEPISPPKQETTYILGELKIIYRFSTIWHPHPQHHLKVKLHNRQFMVHVL